MFTAGNAPLPKPGVLQKQRLLDPSLAVILGVLDFVANDSKYLLQNLYGLSGTLRNAWGGVPSELRAYSLASRTVLVWGLWGIQ